MFRWLSRYVKKIEVFGVGFELREIPEAEALPILASQLRSAVRPSVSPPVESSTPAPAEVEIVELQRYLCVSGVSASSQRKPRELDLAVYGDEIEFHIHDPGKPRPKLWVKRAELQESMNRWASSGSADPLRIPARKARSESEVVFVIGDEDEIEVQAYWWIWVPRNGMKAALKEIDIHAPW
jgi:hypothetical protein